MSISSSLPLNPPDQVYRMQTFLCGCYVILPAKGKLELHPDPKDGVAWRPHMKISEYHGQSALCSNFQCCTALGIPAWRSRAILCGKDTKRFLDKHLHFYFDLAVTYHNIDFVARAKLETSPESALAHAQFGPFALDWEQDPFFDTVRKAIGYLEQMEQSIQSISSMADAQDALMLRNWAEFEVRSFVNKYQGLIQAVRGIYCFAWTSQQEAGLQEPQSVSQRELQRPSRVAKMRWAEKKVHQQHRYAQGIAKKRIPSLYRPRRKGARQPQSEQDRARLQFHQTSFVRWLERRGFPAAMVPENVMKGLKKWTVGWY